MTQIAFTGDLILKEANFKVTEIDKVKNHLEKTKIVTNVESPFIENKNKKPIKSKTTLCQTSEKIKYLNRLKPYISNISNNHINDYGNHSVEHTKRILSENNHLFVGAGYPDEKQHIYVSDKEKINFITYTLRETDKTGNKLFATEQLQGPKNLDLEEIKEISKKYKKNKTIILIHWGEEEVKIPSPQQRRLAREIIDAGADLIIGSHSHTIQPYETYKGKYVFYSLGNFIAPNYHIQIKGKKRFKKQKKRNKESIIPVFDLIKDMTLEKTIRTRFEKGKLHIKDYNARKIRGKNDWKYKLKYDVEKTKVHAENISRAILKKMKGVVR